MRGIWRMFMRGTCWAMGVIREMVGELEKGRASGL